MKKVVTVAAVFLRRVRVHAPNLLSDCTIASAVALFLSVLLLGRFGAPHVEPIEPWSVQAFEIEDVGSPPRLIDEGFAVNDVAELNWFPLLQSARAGCEYGEEYGDP